MDFKETAGKIRSHWNSVSAIVARVHGRGFAEAQIVDHRFITVEGERAIRVEFEVWDSLCDGSAGNFLDSRGPGERVKIVLCLESLKKGEPVSL